MTNIQTTNFYNPQKNDQLLSLWCRENLLPADYKRWQKQLVNFATMEDVKKFVFANKSDYNEQLLDRKTKQISEQEFTLDKNHKYLKLVFFSSAHYFDMDNPQLVGNRAVFRKKLKANRDDVKTAVVFGGDLFGTEWKMKNFRNAKFIENKNGDIEFENEKGNKVLYYGLNKRMKELETDILFALKSGAEVYLMRGAEEHDIYKSVGRNILKEVYERIQETCDKKPEAYNKSLLHYIDEGASLKVNFAREKENGEVVYGTIGLQTNNTDKAYTAQGSIRAAEKSNGKLSADVIFVTNANFSGSIGSDIYVSPQCQYRRTPHAKKPSPATRDYDVFMLSMEEPHNISVRVGDFVPDVGTALKIEEHKEEFKNKVLIDIALKKLQQKQTTANVFRRGM